jgi:hypothetical protein
MFNAYNGGYIPKDDQRFQVFQQEICGLFAQHALVPGPCGSPYGSILSQRATPSHFGSRKRNMTEENDVSWTVLMRNKKDLT